MTATITRDAAMIPRLTRSTDARPVALAVYRQLLELLDELAPDDWGTRLPDCPAWTVADVVGHMIGAARSHASPLEAVRQQWHGRRHAASFDGNALDATNDLQVRDHARLTSDERLATLRTLAPRAVRGRMRVPGPVRRLAVAMPAGGSTPAGTPTRLTLGNLMDAILTRDIWMHRVDIARATGRHLDHDTDTDRRVVEDALAEWAATHGRPFVANLTGPAGGSFRQGAGGEVVELDAVEFCRVLSGRAPAEGLLATRVLF
jgi:uncharacterized protein (TIGR03083 family)